MKSIKFPGANIEMAKGQPEYNSIHMKSIESEQAEVIACYELSDEELALLNKTKRIWYSRLRFTHMDEVDGRPVLRANSFQPFKMWVVTEAENVLIDGPPSNQN